MYQELSHKSFGADEGENNQIKVALGDIRSEEAEREKSGLKTELELESIRLDKEASQKNIT